MVYLKSTKNTLTQTRSNELHSVSNNIKILLTPQYNQGKILIIHKMKNINYIEWPPYDILT